MPQPTRRPRRRALALGLLIAAVLCPQLLAPTASGDAVGDKKAQARRIAIRLDTLQQQAEILAEDYNNAQIRLGQVRQRVTAARHAVAETNRQIDRRRRELARYAISAYTGGGDDTLDLVLKSTGSDLGAREGYASAAIGDKADLVDSLRAAKSDGDAKIADLRRAQKQADQAQALVDDKRKAAAASVSEQQQIYDRVRGELKTLVAAEQARMAAEEQARAEAAARAAAAKARLAAAQQARAEAAARAAAAKARLAAPPPAPRVTPAAAKTPRFTTRPRSTGTSSSTTTRTTTTRRTSSTTTPSSTTSTSSSTSTTGTSTTAGRARGTTTTTTAPATTTTTTTTVVPEQVAAPPTTTDPAPAPAPAPPVGQGAAAAIAAAKSVLGVRYTWGGASPETGFDCSGLVMWAWAHGGISLPHSSAAMYAGARKIPLSALEPGDLLFYGSPVHHVALYIGGGQIIHSPHTGSYVQISSMYYWSDLDGAGRVT